MVTPYVIPNRWIKYDPMVLVDRLTDAKAAILSLASIPYRRVWAESLQALELKREVAGTSRIEGASFNDRELDEALASETPEDRLNRSQRQARSAQRTYRWIATVPDDRPVDGDLIKAIHRKIVTGCDDDHCPPGRIRGADQIVTFGQPRHRGVAGGADCLNAFEDLCAALRREFRRHDKLIQALALHYHMGAMHPFLDGNGRTARALQALVLQRARMKGDLFIAMSNYYYDEKVGYLSALAEAREKNHDLTPFLDFGLRGIALQCRRLLDEIRTQVAASLYRDVMGQMYGRLRTTRKRALAVRQQAILAALLEHDRPIEIEMLFDQLSRAYGSLKAPSKAFIRDLNDLNRIKAIDVLEKDAVIHLSVRLAWATEITEVAFDDAIGRPPDTNSRLVLDR